MAKGSVRGARVFLAAMDVLLVAGVPADAQKPIERLDAEAQAQWLRRAEPAGARACVALYDRITALEPGRSEAQIALARALWWYALMRPPAAVTERQALFRRSIAAARQAQRLAPRDPGGFYWEAASQVQAATEGAEVIAPAAIWRIRELLAKVRALNSWYHHGSIHTVEAELILGMPAWERWMAGESTSRAVDLALEALGFENNCFYGHWVLARALEASGRRNAAISQLDIIVGQGPEAFLPDAPENRVVQRWAAALRARLRELR